MKRFTLALIIVLASVLFSTTNVVASTGTPRVTQTAKLPNTTSILKALNISTNRLTTLRTFTNTGEMPEDMMYNTKIILKKGEDLYLGSTTSSTQDRRIVQFKSSDCTGEDTSSCYINPVGFSTTGRYVLYTNEGNYQYDRYSGKVKKITETQFANLRGPAGPYFVRVAYAAGNISTNGIYVTRRATMKTKYIALSETSNLDAENISPDTMWFAWSTGGSTDATTGVTKPSEINLVRLDTGKKLKPIHLPGGTMAILWTSANSFLAIQASGLDGQKTYNVYAIKNISNSLRGGKIATITDRQFTDVRKIDTSRYLLWDESNAVPSYSIMTAAGKLSAVKTITNPNEDWFHLVGIY